MHKTSAVTVNAPEINNFSGHEEIYNKSNNNNNKSLYNFSGNAKAHRANALIQHFYERLQGYQTFAPFFNHYSNKLYSRRKYTSNKNGSNSNNNDKENSSEGNTFSTRFNSRATISLQPEPWEMIDDLLDTTTARLLRHQADSSIFAMLSYASTNSVSTNNNTTTNNDNDNNSKSLLLPKINLQRNKTQSDQSVNSRASKEIQGDVERSSNHVNITSFSRNTLSRQQQQQEQQEKGLSREINTAAHSMKHENEHQDSMRYTKTTTTNNNNEMMSKEMLLVQTWKADHPEATAAEVRRETNFWHKNAAQQRWNKNRMALQELRRETELLEKSFNSSSYSHAHKLQNKNNGLTAQQKQRLPKTPFSTKPTLHISANRTERLVQSIKESSSNSDNDKSKTGYAEEEAEYIINDGDEDSDEIQGSYKSRTLQTQLNKLRSLQEYAWNTFIKGEMNNDYLYDYEDDNKMENANEQVVWGLNDNVHGNSNYNSDTNNQLVSCNESASLHHWLDAHGWRHHSHRQENAATKIQCAYRCYLARGKVNQARLHRLHCLRELMFTEEEAREEWENAIQITIQLRGNTRYRNNFNEYNNIICDGCNTIQAIADDNSDCCVLLREVNDTTALGKNASKEEMLKYQRAVHLLRNKVHAMLCKRRARVLHEAQLQNELRNYAAITIQRLYRGYLGRLEVQMIRNPALRQLRWVKRVAMCAIKLQTWWRCQHAQHRYVELQRALRIIQSAIKCWLARRVLYRRRAMKLRAEQAAISEYAWRRIAQFYYSYCRGRGTHRVCDKHAAVMSVEKQREVREVKKVMEGKG